MKPSRILLLSYLLIVSSVVAKDRPGSFSSQFEGGLYLLQSPNSHSDHFRLNNLAMEDPALEKKSVGLAAIYSLLLPGMGELYAEGFGSGKFFLMAEGALWLTFASFEAYGGALRDDARTFAIAKAGIDPSGKDDQFYIDIGNFNNIDEYNDKQARDREAERIYQGNIYDVNRGFAWNWESDAERLSYRDQRLSSETVFNNKKFVAAAVIINHVASAINAARAAISYNDDLAAANDDLSFRADVIGGIRNPQGVMITLSKRF